MAGWFTNVRRALGQWASDRLRRPRPLQARPYVPGVDGPPLAPPAPAWPEEMTRDWLAATNPDVMLRQLADKDSARKLLLFACACCRPLVGLVEGEWFRKGVEVCERYADGLASGDEVAAAWATAEPLREVAEEAEDTVEVSAEMAAGALYLTAYPFDEPPQASRSARLAAQALARLALLGMRPKGFGSGAVCGDPYRRERARQCALLRDIFGLPFQPVSIDPTWLACNDGSVVSLAREVYESQRYEVLPVLADALEDAGCADTDILWHCRHGQGHVRGCWLVDALLGKG
jgi:hypothetical protein